MGSTTQSACWKWGLLHIEGNSILYAGPQSSGDRRDSVDGPEERWTGSEQGKTKVDYMAKFKLAFLVLVAAGLAASASARSPIYRCTINGQTVLTDKPCDGATTVPASGVAAASPSGPMGGQVSGAQSIVGDWRGQTQFQGAQNAQVVEEAHSVVPLVLTFSADGKVSGVSADNGCTLLGLWAPGVTPRLFNLDITLKACRYSELNRRYAGTLIATFADNSAQFSLSAYALPIPGQPVKRYDVGATLRR
jgi:hypothetical protein